jgi:hypothetical protein
MFDDMLSEMMFGAIPMSLEGVTTKVHLLPSSNQILITKLFTITHKRHVIDDDDDHPPRVRHNSTPMSTYHLNRYLRC